MGRHETESQTVSAKRVVASRFSSAENVPLVSLKRLIVRLKSNLLVYQSSSRLAEFSVIQFLDVMLEHATQSASKRAGQGKDVRFLLCNALRIHH